MNQPPARTLSIVASNQRAKNDLTQNIKNIIGHEIEVNGYALDEVYSAPIASDLVILSTNSLYDDAKQLFPNSPIMVGKRILTGHNIEEVIMVPAHSRALVVCKFIDVANQVIEAFHDFGIDHIDYIPFGQGLEIDPQSVDLAITPNMESIVPVGVKRVINIGARALSTDTFLQILDFFSLDIGYLDLFEKSLIRQHINVCRKIKSILDNSNRLRRYQSAILREIDEGILVLNEYGKVMLHNRTMEQIFSQGKTEFIQNPNLKRILAMLDDEKNYRDELGESDRSTALTIKYNDQSLYCHRDILSFGESIHSFYTFRKVEQVEALAQSIHRKMYSKGFRAKYTFDDIWGHQGELQYNKEQAKRFASTDQSILILGESGTGKELFAQAIHNASHRADKPFVGVNLASISRSLLESELFGYQEGAFTGAQKGGKRGLFELADGGTIFLDEIGDIPLSIQILLLRVLEEHEFTRVGGDQPISVNVRVIAATNKPLKQEIAARRFRKDLFYRLNTLPIYTTPLRRMTEDIPGFMEAYARKRFGAAKPVDPSVWEQLSRYSWPGNFRELKNIVEYAYISSADCAVITLSHFPKYILEDILLSPALLEVFRDDPLTLEVLHLFAKAHPASIGRNSLVRQAGLRGILLTEGSAKRILSVLEKERLIRVGTTKQGSAATPLGLQIHDIVYGQQDLDGLLSQERAGGLD